MTDTAQRKGRWKLLAVVLVCAAPMLMSYLTYYVIKPEGRTNYGTLLDPRVHPMPQLGLRTLDGAPIELSAYKGKWLMLQTGAGACAKECKDALYTMRQLRTMQGKAMTRIERVWLITDAEPLDTVLMRDLDGTRMLRAQAEPLAKWLPVEAGGKASEHYYLVDPLGNLMMRFPKQPDPKKVSKDLNKLLKASAIG
ncbi:MAG: cytochrome C oxidase subunit I [Pseudomonadota bacterium]